MITSEKEKVLRVLDLVCEQETDCLQALLPPVHVISEKEIITLRRKLSIFEESKQVAVLAVDIPTYLDRCLQLKEARLFHEDLTGRYAQSSDFILS